MLEEAFVARLFADLRQWFLVVISILSSIFLYSLDNTVVADITPVGTTCDYVQNSWLIELQSAVNRFGDVMKLPWLSVGYNPKPYPTK